MVTYEVIYKVGEITYPSTFDVRLEEVCAAGIYFNTLFSAYVYYYHDNVSSISFSDNGTLTHLAMPPPYLPADREHFLHKHYQLQNVICATWVTDPIFKDKLTTTSYLHNRFELCDLINSQTGWM